MAETGGVKHIISLGSFCSVALEIERLGFRDGSYPFDWVLSHSLQHVIQLVNDNFDGFLDINGLNQWKSVPSTYEDVQYGIAFVHDFDRWHSLESQIASVRNKYDRRIRRFYNAISEECLFVRYIENMEDYEYIVKNSDAISQFFKKYNRSNEIIYIANSELRDCLPKTSDNARICFVEKDYDDTVARRFGDKCPEFVELLSSTYYSKSRHEQNMRFYQKKHRFDILTKVKKKMCAVVNDYKYGSYIHDKRL